MAGAKLSNYLQVIVIGKMLGCVVSQPRTRNGAVEWKQDAKMEYGPMAGAFDLRNGWRAV